jgi:hypothetical protein
MNAMFRTLTAQLADTPQSHIMSLFGADEEELTKASLVEPPKQDTLFPAEKKPIKKLTIDEISTFLKDRKYDGGRHYALLEQKIEEKLIHLPEELTKTFKDVAQHMTTRLSQGNNYSLFLKYLVDGLRINPQAHYLNNDLLYNNVKTLIEKNPDGPAQYRIHLFNQDISSDEGLNTLESILRSFDLKESKEKPIDVAFLPHLLRDMNKVVPFIRENVDYVITTSRYTADAMSRLWTFKESTRVWPVSIHNPGKMKYDEQLKNRTPL